MTVAKASRPPQAIWKIEKPKSPRDNLEQLEADLNIRKFLLDVVKEKKLDIDIAESIIDGEVIETMEGASNVSVILHDPERILIRSGVFHEDVRTKRQGHKTRVRKIDVDLDGIVFRLVQANKSGEDLTLTFEDRSVARLRQHFGPKKAKRGKVTRAEFIYSLTNAVTAERIRFYSPELHKKQPLAKRARDERKEIKDRRREGGINPDAKITVKGVKADRNQIKNMETVLEVAVRSNAGPKATKALVVACITESLFRNTKGGTGSSVGILQLLDSWLDGSTSTNGGRRDVELVAQMFLSRGFYGNGGAIDIENRGGAGDFATIAQMVQGSGTPDGSNYREWGDEADAIIEAFGQLSTRRLYRKYEFKVERDETYWDAMVRLAEEVQWRLFMVRGWLYYIAEDDLINSRPRVQITEDHDAVDSIDWDIDEGKPVHTAEVTTRIHRWGAPPGSVISIDEAGPANGRWIVADITRKLFSPEATIHLKRMTPRLPEPRPELRPQRDSEDLGGSERIDRAYEMAIKISNKNLPYVWGGGHAEAGKPTLGGYDCSGYTAAVLLAGDMLPSEWESGVPASGTFADSWGKAGKGKEMTVWANSGHVWIEFYGREWDRADTSAYGTPTTSGPHVRKGGGRPTAGFTPRHWPGI